MPIIISQTARIINGFVSDCKPIKRISYAPRTTLKEAFDKLELSGDTRTQCNKFLSELNKTEEVKKFRGLKADLCKLLAKAIKGHSFNKLRRENQSEAGLVNQTIEEGLNKIGEKFTISSSPVVNHRSNSLIEQKELDLHWYRDHRYSEHSISPSPAPAAKNSRSSLWGNNDNFYA